MGQVLQFPKRDPKATESNAEEDAEKEAKKRERLIRAIQAAKHHFSRKLF